MVYDAVLLFGLGFAVVFAVLLLTGTSEADVGGRRMLVQVVLFIAVGAYFTWCWSRSGQTLALKTWKLQVVDAAGQPPNLPRAAARYVLAYTLALPGLLYIAAREPSPRGALTALALGFLLMLLPALFDRQRRLLHDRWTGTRIARVD